MHTPPFHRRILPWVFVLCFFAIAPVLVFYTAGYRYNSKKGYVERNGTVIIDSTPKKASITLDGRNIADLSPITIQNMPTGIHHFNLQLPGYYSWEKSLDIHPDIVTFLNTIRLWKKSDPVLVTTGTIDLVSWSPNNVYLLIISHTTTTHFRIEDTRGNIRTSGTLVLPPKDIHAIWSMDASAVFIESMIDGTSWLINTSHNQPPLDLPKAQYRFTPSELIGNDGKAIISIQLNDGTMRRTPLGQHIDIGQNALLQNVTSTHDAILIFTQNPDTGIILPSGSWKIAEETESTILLRDESRWLSVFTRSQLPESQSAQGDILRSIKISGTRTVLLIQDSEIWRWDLMHAPELLLRQSEPIINAGWHYMGNDIFYATKKNVYALNLDARDGYVSTNLATFDTIQDITVGATGIITVAGIKNSTIGLWNIETE